MTGISLECKARTKWLYTKSVLSEVSAQYKDMMSIHCTDIEQQNHNVGNKVLVDKIVECAQQKMVNPF